MIEEAALLKAVSLFGKEIEKSASSLISDAKAELHQFCSDDIASYIKNQYERLSHTKTILRGNTPVYFYSVYFPLSLTSDGELHETSSLDSTFGKNKFITVIGDAGSGKSMLAKHLFLRALQEKQQIPIFVELRYLESDAVDIATFLKKRIFRGQLAKSAAVLERMLKAGKFVFFLDGYDEIASNNKKAVVSSIDAFLEDYPENRCLITTRPYSDIDLLPMFRNMRICRLDETNGNIDAFIDLQLTDEPELAQEIKSSISDGVARHIHSYLSNPLLLSLYILTYQSNAEIPSKKYIFYRRVINALFSEHDSKTKLGFVREKQTSLLQEQFEKVLKAFSFVSYFDDAFSFDHDDLVDRLEAVKERLGDIEFSNIDFLNDMKVAVSLWVEDGGRVSFAHRSLQEYFAAAFIKNMEEKNKKKVYEHLVKHMPTPIRGRAEIENFLSLCEEMDRLVFYENYSIPLLEELRRKLLDPSSRLKAYVEFFCDGLTFRKHGGKGDKAKISATASVREEVFRSIYLHFDHTVKLNGLIGSVDAKTLLFECSISPGKLRKSFDRITFSTCPALREAVLRHAVKNDGETLANEFYDYLETEITEKRGEIRRSMKVNSGFIDLLRP